MKIEKLEAADLSFGMTLFLEETKIRYKASAVWINAVPMVAIELDLVINSKRIPDLDVLIVI